MKVDEERWVHTVLLSNLTDDTQYCVVAGMPMYPAEAVTFRTAPASSNATVSFLDGGDAGTTNIYTALNARARLLNPPPLFAIAGGDLAYANNFPTCYRVWDKWLAQYQRSMHTAAGDTVPMAVVIGNHEAQQEKWGLATGRGQLLLRLSRKKKTAPCTPDGRTIRTRSEAPQA